MCQAGKRGRADTKPRSAHLFARPHAAALVGSIIALDSARLSATVHESVHATFGGESCTGTKRAFVDDWFMFVTMRRAERALAGTQSWFDWTPEQMERAASDYLTYCGQYEIIGDKIEHHIEHSLLPEWVGTTKIRFAKLDGDQLFLSTAPLDSTGVGHTRGVLERAIRAQSG